MRSIVYGIVGAGRASEAALPAGLGEAELIAVEEGQVAALLSRLPDDDALPTAVDQVLEYARIVEDLHQQMAIVPMRYGCYIHHLDQVADFLHLHEGALLDALVTIEGCDEMGVRVLLAGAETDVPRAAVRPPDGQAPENPGADYLSSRRRFYGEHEAAERACSEWAARARDAFSGLFRRASRECVVRPEGTLLSLSFLVERVRVPAFMDAFHRFQQTSSAGAVCSGPWPPYVFVASLARPGEAAQAEMQFLHEQKG